MLDKEKITIQNAEYEDIGELLEACRIIAESTPNCPWTEDYPDRATLLHDYSCGALKKIMYGDELAGIVCFGEMNEFEDCFEPEPELRVCDMARFGLLPRYQGSGLSVQIILMGQAMIEAQNYDVARLFAAEEQPGVIALYELMGFHRVNEMCHTVNGICIKGYCYEKRREDLTAEDMELTREVTTAKLSKDRTR